MNVQDWDERDTHSRHDAEYAADKAREEAEEEAQRIQRESDLATERYETAQYNLYEAFLGAVEAQDATKAIELSKDMDVNFDGDDRAENSHFVLLKGLENYHKERTVYGHGYGLEFHGDLPTLFVSAYQCSCYITKAKTKNGYFMHFFGAKYFFEDSTVMCATFNTLAKAANDAQSYE